MVAKRLDDMLCKYNDTEGVITLHFKNINNIHIPKIHTQTP